VPRLLAFTEQKLERLRENVAAGRVKKKDVIARRLYRWLNRWGMERFFDVKCDEGAFTLNKAVRSQESEVRILKPVDLHMRLGDIRAHPTGESFRASNDSVTCWHSEF
jgi:hypothetical protein